MDKTEVTEIRPVYLYNSVRTNFIAGGGSIQAAGAQVRLALTPRFALLVTNGLYIHYHASPWTLLSISNEPGRR
jgi:hypothetical protein